MGNLDRENKQKNSRAKRVIYFLIYGQFRFIRFQTNAREAREFFFDIKNWQPRTNRAKNFWPKTYTNARDAREFFFYLKNCKIFCYIKKIIEFFFKREPTLEKKGAEIELFQRSRNSAPFFWRSRNFGSALFFGSFYVLKNFQ